VLVAVGAAALVVGWCAFLLWRVHHPRLEIPGMPGMYWDPHKTVALGEPSWDLRLLRLLPEALLCFTGLLFLVAVVGGWWLGWRAAWSGRLRLLVIWSGLLVAAWGSARVLYNTSFDAPLEAPANPNTTPNPSHTPPDELRRQEILVYLDPWLAGVALPMAILFIPVLLAETWSVYALSRAGVRSRRREEAPA